MTYVNHETRFKSMLDDGIPVAEIAAKLNVTERAVRVHKAKEDGKLTALQLADAVGASYRQINHWTSRGYIKSMDLGQVKGEGKQRKGSGSHHMFEPETAGVVGLVMELLAIGFEVDAAFRVARQMDATGALNHGGSGEHATAMIVFPHGWKLVKAVS